MVRNKDQRPPKDYDGSTMDMFPMPIHVDYTSQEKRGVRARNCGSRSSARETMGRIVAGAVVEKYLALADGVEIVSFVSSVGIEHLFSAPPTHPSPSTNPSFFELLGTIIRSEVDAFLPVRCPNGEASK